MLPLKVSLSVMFEKILSIRVEEYPDQIGKFAECAGDLSYVEIACAAVFVSLNNSSIVSFCCFTKISRLEPRLKFKVRGREIGRARQTFQSGIQILEKDEGYMEEIVLKKGN